MSDHPKIQPEISQPISENLQKLADLFPSAVKDGALDVEALREELGNFAEIQPGDEKYELNWVGKQTAKKKTFEPLLGKTLALKDDGKNSDATENLYIEGDNLEALKLLRQNYYGEVKMIYIDPPYNTGKDFVYTDKFKVSEEESEEEEGAVSETGERLVKNEKSSNRFHARWLDMMYPRLRLAKDLLREDGVIFISLDDGEIANLRSICDEVFGQNNFLTQIIIQSNRRGQTYKEIARCHESILVYYKSENSGVFELAKADGALPYKDNQGGYDLWELRNRNPKFGKHNRPNLYFPIFIDPESINPTTGLCKISLEESDVYNIATYPKNSEGGDSCWRWGKPKVTKEGIGEQKTFAKQRKDGGWNIYEKSRKSTTKAKSIWADTGVISEQGTIQSGHINMSGILQFPKPLMLVERTLRLGSAKEDIILDFFSGSATTAHAVMQLNSEDGGRRKHIMVQLPEVCDVKSEAAKAGYATVAEIGKERIRRAGDKITEELRAKRAELEAKGKLEQETNPYIQDPDSLDVGFKSFRIEDTKINWLKKDLRGEDLEAEAGLTTQDALDFVPGFTDQDILYELMLRQSNIPLTHSITQPEKTGERTYLYGDAYLICLEENITKELVETLAALEPTPLKYFFRDSAFGKDIALKDETFRRLNAEIAKNFGDDAEAYTVEFI